MGIQNCSEVTYIIERKIFTNITTYSVKQQLFQINLIDTTRYIWKERIDEIYCYFVKVKQLLNKMPNAIMRGGGNNDLSLI